MINLEKLKQAREVTTQGGVIRSRKGTLIAMAPDLADAVIELAGALQMVDASLNAYGDDPDSYRRLCIKTALAKHIKGERT